MYWQYRGRCFRGSDQCLYQGPLQSPLDHRVVYAGLKLKSQTRLRLDIYSRGYKATYFKS